jgi:hypothetical protein
MLFKIGGTYTFKGLDKGLLESLGPSGIVTTINKGSFFNNNSSNRFDISLCTYAFSRNFFFIVVLSLIFGKNLKVNCLSYFFG